jgi:hypothetical protein
MDSSKQQVNVFPISTEEGNAKIEFRKKKFYLHSHKEDSKPIILNLDNMTSVVNHLPEFQKGARDIENAKKLFLSQKGDHDFEYDDANQKTIIVSMYKQFQTRLILNVYNKTPYIWLRLFVNPNYEKEEVAEKKSKKRKLTVETYFPCKGGVILNDVNVEQLSNFVASV